MQEVQWLFCCICGHLGLGLHQLSVVCHRNSSAAATPPRPFWALRLARSARITLALPVGEIGFLFRLQPSTDWHSTSSLHLSISRSIVRAGEKGVETRQTEKALDQHYYFLPLGRGLNIQPCASDCADRAGGI